MLSFSYKIHGKQRVEKLKTIFVGRPIWMSALMLFCDYMTFIYMPFDLFLKPVDQDGEVWFGFMLHGWWAKATEPLHWLIYGAGLYGFYKMKPWMFPWAALYTFQVSISMLVWSLIYGGGNLVLGAIASVPFAILGVLLWRAKVLFNGMVERQTADSGITNG